MGKIASKGNYLDGKQIGKWQFFQISGRIWREGEIKNNKQHGHWTSYFNNGNIETTGYYINGTDTGYFDRKSNILERILMQMVFVLESILLFILMEK